MPEFRVNLFLYRKTDDQDYLCIISSPTEALSGPFA